MIYEHNGARYRVTLQPLPDGRLRALLDDREVMVRAQPLDGGWLLEIEGQQARVYCAARGGERFVAVQGEVYTLTAAETRRRVGGHGAGDLTAQMPGQVRELLICAGDSVTRGQTLLLLEAMKMEIRVTAPADGRVKRVLVQAGSIVDRGQRLVEMEQEQR